MNGAAVSSIAGLRLEACKLERLLRLLSCDRGHRRWQSVPTSGRTNAVFIAGTQQHHGKTTITLGLVHALLARHVRLAYQKPVGQQTVSVESDGKILQVDRDVDVFKHLWPQLIVFCR
jgi:hypothetical protein